jgi:hypothetical protein
MGGTVLAQVGRQVVTGAAEPELQRVRIACAIVRAFPIGHVMALPQNVHRTFSGDEEAAP